MGWENMRPEQAHECKGRPYLWFAKEGQTWRCTAKIGADKHACGKLWEVYRAADGTGSGQLAWRLLDDEAAQAISAKRGEVDMVADRLAREELESQLYAAHLADEGKGTTQSLAEMAIIKWTLDELERRGMAKWVTGS